MSNKVKPGQRWEWTATGSPFSIVSFDETDYLAEVVYDNGRKAIYSHGVILANARLLPAVAAPAKADDVPVGSRWAWRAEFGRPAFTVVGPVVSGYVTHIRYDDGSVAAQAMAHIIANATRIDAPAEAAPVSRTCHRCEWAESDCRCAKPAPEPRQDEAWSVHLEAEAKIRAKMTSWEGDEEKPRRARESRKARAFIGDPPDLRCTQWYGVSITDTRRK